MVGNLDCHLRLGEAPGRLVKHTSGCVWEGICKDN
jgi:hypothetical protein